MLFGLPVAEHAWEPLSRYAVEFAATTGKPKGIDRQVLSESRAAAGLTGERRRWRPSPPGTPGSPTQRRKQR